MVKTTATKPKKPYLDFPLTAHNNGQWCKKIRGKVHFFGIWAEADQALANYCEVRDDLQAGRQPRTTTSEPSLRDVCNAYLTRMQQREETATNFSRLLRYSSRPARPLWKICGSDTDTTNRVRRLPNQDREELFFESADKNRRRDSHDSEVGLRIGLDRKGP